MFLCICGSEFTEQQERDEHVVTASWANDWTHGPYLDSRDNPSPTAPIYQFRKFLQHQVKTADHPASTDDMRREIDRLRMLLAGALMHCDDMEEPECSEHLLDLLESTTDPETVQIMARSNL